MKKRITAMLAAVVLALGILFVGAAPASAGTCTVITSSWHLCGKVTSGGTCGVKVVNNWPAKYGTVRTLYKGQSSNRYFRDTDGYMIPAACKAAGQTKGKWIKIRDGQSVYLYANR